MASCTQWTVDRSHLYPPQPHDWPVSYRFLNGGATPGYKIYATCKSDAQILVSYAFEIHFLPVDLQ
jgi:hypothetical protein